MLKARPAILALKEYHPPLGNRSGLRLDFNENTRGASPRVLERLRRLTLDDMAIYPVREPVERVLASFLGVRWEEMSLTNGVDEAIHLMCETYLDKGDEAIIAVPTFAMYEICAAATGASVIAVPSRADFSFPLEAVLAAITPRTRFIAIANPNNPTGTVAPAESLLRIASAAPDAAILIDEAYYEFYGETLLGKIGSIPNLFVARTFSKAYGMAGLRAGVLAGSQEQLRMVRRAASPYNVNSLALLALPVALEDQEYMRAYVAEAQETRELLQQELGRLGIRFCPSRANFVLAQIGPRHGEFVAAMKRRGILVRDRSTDYGCEGWVRMTLGSKEHLGMLLSALREVLQEIQVAEVSL